MSGQVIREVQTPYTVNPDDEAIGRDTIIIRRNGEPVAVVMPYADYQAFLAQKPASPVSLPIDPEFEKQWATFQRLKPELLQKYKGQWVAIVNEQVAAVGPTSNAVLDEVLERFGDVPMCIQEVLEKPRVYRMTGRTIIHSTAQEPSQ